MRFPYGVGFAGLHDGSVIPGGSYARYCNHVAGLEGNRRERREGNIDTARRVGDKKRRSLQVGPKIVVSDYSLQVYGIAQSCLLIRQAVDLVCLGQGGQRPAVGSRWLRERRGADWDEASHRRNQDQVAVQVQDIYPYFYPSTRFGRTGVPRSASWRSEGPAVSGSRSVCAPCLFTHTFTRPATLMDDRARTMCGRCGTK